MEELLNKLGKELVFSPYLSAMILDRDNNIVWHNQRFADDFKLGDNLVGMNCYHVTGSQDKHDNCPLDTSLTTGKRVKGYLDYGTNNFFYLTVPLDDNHAAKIHVFLPKQPDNREVNI